MKKIEVKGMVTEVKYIKNGDKLLRLATIDAGLFSPLEVCSDLFESGDVGRKVKIVFEIGSEIVTWRD